MDRTVMKSARVPRYLGKLVVLVLEVVHMQSVAQGSIVRRSIVDTQVSRRRPGLAHASFILIVIHYPIKGR